jgi:quercetin dioxygenase-like cupin family protein
MQMEQLMLTGKELRVAVARQTTQVSWRRLTGALVATWIFSAAAVSVAFGQASSRPCLPERTDEPRSTCSTGSEKLGRLSDGPVFWHLDVYPTRAAAETAKGPRGTVIESFGKVWLFTIAEANWQPAAGVRIAKIGPLPVTPNVEYTAVYLEGIFDPGTEAPIHVHSGPEAFYALTGDTCLETPDGVVTGREIVVKGGPPMLLVATGTARRRGVALILHDSSQPATTLVHDWTPNGLCKTKH